MANNFNNSNVTNFLNLNDTTSTVTYHFNTKYREKYYETQSINCDLKINPQQSDVIALRLSSITIPNSWYVFTNLLNNNRFTIQAVDTNGKTEVLEVVIPEGNYTAEELQTFLNTQYFHLSERRYSFSRLEFCISKHNLKSTFRIIEGPINTTFKFHLFFVQSDTINIMSTCGWILGFRYGKYLNVKDQISSEGLYNGGGDRFIYILLKETPQTSDARNKHIICRESGQIFNLDYIMGKIPLQNGKFSINTDETMDNNVTFRKTRVYPNTKTITGFNVQLIDQFGQDIFLNNMDFSFSIEMIIQT